MQMEHSPLHTSTERIVLKGMLHVFKYYSIRMTLQAKELIKDWLK